MGLYNYDNSVLEGIINNLPSTSLVPRVADVYEPTPMNKDAFIYALMLECGELEFLVPSLPLAKSFITSWAITNRDLWQQLYNTLWYKYNPIWNKDGKYTHTETGENSETETTKTDESSKKDETKTGAGHKTSDLSQSETLDGTNTNKVTGFNDDTFANNTQDTTVNTRNGSVTETTENTDEEHTTGNNTVNRNNTINKNGNNTKTYTDIEQGNIGVTTTQQMIEEEREKALFNIYDFIIKSFRDRFCLTVY